MKHHWIEKLFFTLGRRSLSVACVLVIAALCAPIYLVSQGLAHHRMGIDENALGSDDYRRYPRLEASLPRGFEDEEALGQPQGPISEIFEQSLLEAGLTPYTLTWSRPSGSAVKGLCRSVHAIQRSPRGGASSLSLLVVTVLRGGQWAGQPDRRIADLQQSAGALFSAHDKVTKGRSLTRDVVWLVLDPYCDPSHSLGHWLSIHSPRNPLDATQALLKHPGFPRAGRISEAIVLDWGASSAATPASQLRVDPFTSSAALPNSDMFALSAKLAQIGLPMHLVSTDLDRDAWTDSDLSASAIRTRIESECRNPVVRTLALTSLNVVNAVWSASRVAFPNMLSAAQLKRLEEAARAFLRLAFPRADAKAVNAPLVHSHIDAITLRIVSFGAEGKDERENMASGAAWMASSLILQLDSLVERFHHATNTYLPISLSSHIKTEVYALALWLLEGSALTAAVSIGRPLISAEGLSIPMALLRLLLSALVVGLTAVLGAVAADNWALATVLQLPLTLAGVGAACALARGASPTPGK